jgi:hypothetical protein
MNLDNTIFSKLILTREYTITCSSDDKNIDIGRCPDYALEWSDEQNKLHWPDNHNYLQGLSSPTNSSGLSSPTNSSGLPSPTNSSSLPSPTNNSLETLLLLQEYNNSKKNKKRNTYYKLFRKIENKIFENNKDIIIFCSLEVLVCNIDDNLTDLNLSKSGKELWKVIKKIKPFIVVDFKYYSAELIEWCKTNLDTDNLTIYSIIKEQEEFNNDFTSYILIDNNYCDEYKNQIFIQNTNVNETLEKLLLHL